MRTHPNAYALVFSPNGENILNATLTRYAYGLWPSGFPGSVVGLLVDDGTGSTEVEIRAALTVTVLDPLFYAQVTGAVTDYVWCEMDRLRAEASAAEEADPLHGFGPDEIVVGAGGETLAEAAAAEAGGAS